MTRRSPDDPNVAMFGEQLQDTEGPAGDPDLDRRSRPRSTTNLEKVTTGDTSPEDGATAMQEAATSIGTGQ